MQFRTRGSGGREVTGCGALLALFGLVLLTPAGVFLIKAVGWISVVLGLIFVAFGIYYWLAGSRRRHF